MGGGSGEEEAACDDTGEAFTAGTSITVTTTGDACNAPSLSDNSGEVDSLIIDCSDRDTDDSMSDFVSVSCPAETASYYCADGLAFRDNGDDDTELFEDTEITCVGEEDSEVIEEDELIIG